MKHKIILKKQNLQNKKIKRMPRKEKKNYKKFLEFSEAFNSISLKKEEIEQLFKSPDTNVNAIAGFGLLAKVLIEENNGK